MWPLTFISEADLKKHVRETISQYGVKLISYDVKRFNSNIIDPIKLLFDKMVYGTTWEELIKNEIFRQRDKASNNDIGYFHQRFFQYMPGCVVPDKGWDVIYKSKDGIMVPDAGKVHTIYVEMKNKHNTMNSAASARTYTKMQNAILHDDDCACFLVEAIAKKSQNIKWGASLDGVHMEHRFIRRVSMDVFYAMITGVEDAFYQLCCALPKVIEDVIADTSISIPRDTVIEEMREKAAIQLRKRADNEELAMVMAFYMLGFGDYIGFRGY